VAKHSTLFSSLVTIARAAAVAAPAAAAALASSASYAEDAAAPTISSQGRDTIFVTAPRAERFGPVSETHRSLSSEEVVALHAQDAAVILRRLPSAYVPTNSRGESLIYLRSAGERQVAAFFDGALLNVPWDNRFDLGLVPASVIQSVTSASGTLSPQYGVNALGAVAFFPISPSAGQTSAGLNVEAGSEGRTGVNASLSAPLGRFDTLMSLDHRSRNGNTLPGDAVTPFHQASDSVRTNTDFESLSGLARAEWDMAGATLAATLLASQSDYGIAPESDRADARFWRFPETQTIMAVLSGTAPLGERSDLTSSVWVQNFHQTIDSYTDATYVTLEDREEDRDRTYGARAIARSNFARTTLTGSVNLLQSRHRQRDSAFSANGALSGTPDDLSFQQRAASVGVDVEHDLTSNVQFDVGAGVDWVDYIETGDKPSVPVFSAPVVRAGVSWTPDDRSRFRVAIGRKSRMPTMRELFGTAVHRFLINLDLQPEQITTAELGWDYDDGPFRIATVIFGQDVENTIDRRVVGGLRQRINLDGSWVTGVETTAELQLSPSWRLSGAATATRTRRKSVAPGEPDRIAERPSLLARLALDYTSSGGSTLGLEVQHTGRAYSMDDAGDFVPLQISTQYNVRASHPLAFASTGDTAAELFVSAENLFDTVVEPQAGLPAPGRTLLAGLRLSW